MAAPDPFSNLPPEISAELLALQRRRQLADMMAQQSFQPIQRAQSKSRYEVPMSPLQPIAQVLTGLAAKSKQDEGDKQMGELGNRYQAGVANELAKYRATRSGPEIGPTEQTPAQGPRAAMESALANRWIKSHPQVQFDMQRLAKDEDRGVITKQVPVGDGTMVQTMESQDNGRTWKNLGVPSPKFAKQVAPSIVNERQLPPPVAVMRRDGKGAEFVSREDAVGRIPAPMDVGLQSALAGGKAGGKEKGEAQAKAEIGLPQVISSANQSIQQIDDLLKHPGFSSTVGFTLTPGMRFIEGSSEADFMARLNQVKGGAFLEAFNTLKGGGAISEVEGQKATDAITRMGKSQSEKEFTAAAEEFKRVIKSGVENAKIKAQGGRPAAVPSGVVDFNSLPP
jgi:hypothetical protein